MELFGSLRGRLYDSNKNLVMATMSTIGGIASAMGPAVEKSSKVYMFNLRTSTSSYKFYILIYCSLEASISVGEVWILQGILSDVLKCLGDNKKQMRECTVNTLDSWVAAVQLDKMVTVCPCLIFKTQLLAVYWVLWEFWVCRFLTL